MLRILSIREEPRIIVTSHYDGNIQAKDVVDLIMPKNLGLRVSRFTSEARHTHVAGRIVMMDAILAIRREKAGILEGTSFMALPQNDYGEDSEVDHLHLIQTRPNKALEYMRRNDNLIHAFQGLFRSLEGEISNLVAWCTDPATLKHLHEMRQSQAPAPQPATPTTPVYPYVAETYPQPYYDIPVNSPIPSEHTPEEFCYYGVGSEHHPIHFEQGECLGWAGVEEEVEPYIRSRSDPIPISSNGDYSGMPTDWYDGPLETEQRNGEVGEQQEGNTETEDPFDFSRMMRSTEDSDYNPGAAALRDTASSAPPRRTSRFNAWIPARFQGRK
jgi:hypothetical protein